MKQIGFYFFFSVKYATLPSSTDYSFSGAKFPSNRALEIAGAIAH